MLKWMICFRCIIAFVMHLRMFYFNAFLCLCSWDLDPSLNDSSSIVVASSRMRGDVIEVMKTMIHDQYLLMHPWAEATRRIVYVQNRLSHSALGFKTPKEMYTGKKPEVSHLNIFGCPVYVHIPKENRNKVGSFRKEGNICWIL